MKRYLKFLSSEDGAVTVDWVVLTAAVVSLAILAMFAIFDGSTNMGDTVRDYLTDTGIEEIWDPETADS
ncbi:hypothetical protein [Sulfitobacter sp.]|uniref:hypothetical protein n=1 Tax=Sulfitobacter sp. TaxID=1903071 RepID=UPI00329A707F